ncbi:survival motor neuron protein 1-like [Anneissia japonica]|uniref:survival motor neuron protein 1-like n=1 Tax=Anneissia japonica TaxID=1529436 RepID=UPI001425BADF|nr:survival motor neuron protein 1-like [Anneissia japonica]
MNLSERRSHALHCCCMQRSMHHERATTMAEFSGDVQQVDVMFRVDSQQIPGSHENIWDDTALIKAYDKAVESVKKDLNADGESVEPKKNNQKRRKKNKKKKLKWNVGDCCQAKYSVDGIYYESIINSVDQDRGSCWVTFKEYGNEEEVELSELRPSQSKNRPARHDISENETGSTMEFSDYMYSPAHPAEYLGPHGPWHPNPWMMPPMHPPQQFMPPYSMPAVSPYTVPMPYFPRPSGFQNMSSRVPPVPPPPPLIRPPNVETDEDDDALHSMLIAWYMSGYHTGYYLGLKDGEKQSRSPAPKKLKMKKMKNSRLKVNINQTQDSSSNCKAPSEDET